jgi:hypothetical protein
MKLVLLILAVVLLVVLLGCEGGTWYIPQVPQSR